MTAAFIMYIVIAFLFVSNWLAAWTHEPDAVKFMAKRLRIGVIPLFAVSSALWPLALICVFAWCVRELFFGKGVCS